MGQRLNNFIIRYTWLFPLILMVVSAVYYTNWFERLFAENPLAYYLPIYKELEFSISMLLLTTSLLNWALVGFWKYLCSGSCKPTWEIKNDRK